MVKLYKHNVETRALWRGNKPCAHRACEKPAIHMHGVTCVTHGYCHEHRCCARCGLWINECDCKVPFSPTQRWTDRYSAGGPDLSKPAEVPKQGWWRTFCQRYLGT